MTNEEAIEFGKRVAITAIDMPLNEKMKDDTLSFVQMAIEALEKQIYVKCKDIITADNVNVGEICDKCGYFISIHRNYCLNCGQRIADWSEKE